MIKIQINGQEIETHENTPILTIAREHGINIPTLCFLENYKPFTSCMLCVVENKKTGDLLPSCSAYAQDGMILETENQQVQKARKIALEFLLSEHIGDCYAPCTLGCSSKTDIPLILSQIQQGKIEEAVITLKQYIPIPGIISRICSAPCEKTCHRARVNGAVSIATLEKYLADYSLAQKTPDIPKCKPYNNKKIAIIGSGPMGLSSAYYLQLEGYKCTIFDKNDKLGGMLRYGVSQEILPHEILNKEIAYLKHLDVDFSLKTEVGKDIALESLRENFDAIIIATGKFDEEQKELFGVDTTNLGVKIHPQTFQTSKDGIFAGGGALHFRHMAIKSVADGRFIVSAINKYFGINDLAPTPPKFKVIIGKMNETEKKNFIQDSPSISPVKPVKDNQYSQPEAKTEASRCFHCDCDKLHTCKLKIFSEQYGANPRKYKRSENHTYKKFSNHPEIAFEPGKCIKCGICIQLCKKEKEPIGLTFEGRGIETVVTVSLNETLEKGLQHIAKACVEQCPVGALMFKDRNKNEG